MSLEMTVERAQRIKNDAIDLAGDYLEKRPDVAEVVLKQLLKCDPEHPDGLQLLGLAKHRMGQNTEAIEIFQTALDLDPYNSDNYNNIGLAYGGLGDHERAIKNMLKANELDPEKFIFLNNIALQYRVMGDRQKAIETFKRALEMAPYEPQIWTNLGGVYGELKDIEKSIECFNQALECNPSYPAAHVDLAFAYHLLEDWERGFEEYEWRFEYFGQMNYYKKAYDQEKRWDGRESLEGKRIMVYGEQGLGDIVQFIRWIPELKKRGAHVIIHCHLGLDSLLKRMDFIDETVNRDIVNNTGDEFPEYDIQCSIMSLPHLLQSFDITGKPYIKPVVNTFKKYIEEEYGTEKLKVGVCWAGSPSHPHDQRRSIALKQFLPIYNRPDIKMFSLQFDTRPRKYGPGFEMRPGSDGMIVDFAEGCEDMRLVDLTTMIQSMEDTCTILAGLDLIISCDTCVVHLAGAMGVPCWMLLPFSGDWRWGLERTNCLWYDSVRVFRQKKIDDWKGVFEEVQSALDNGKYA